LVRRTEIVCRCEDCIITRKRVDSGGIFANSESGFAGFGWIFGMDGGESGADGMVCFIAV